jgi:hypothetical protein
MERRLQARDEVVAGVAGEIQSDQVVEVMGKGISPTVGNFFAVLSSLLTQYDVQMAAREAKGRHGHVNIYRLGHLLGAMHKAEDGLRSVIGKFTNPEVMMTAEIARQLVDILTTCFTVNWKTNEFDLPPLRKFYKQLDQFAATGKNPTLIDR